MRFSPFILLSLICTRLVWAVGPACPQADQLVCKAETLTTTSPLRIDGGVSADLSTRRTLSCLVASGSQAGCLSAADFAIFNAKADSPHNLLSATHGDTTTASVARGDLITGQTASPSWKRLGIDSTITRYLANTGGTAHNEPAWDLVNLSD